MYNVECNTFLVEVSTNMFMMLQQGPIFIAVKGFSSKKVMKNNLLIGHKHGKKIYVIERFVINVLWKGIISCLWVHVGARLDVLWKENIVFLWVMKNDFILMIVCYSDFS
jgi:hypothetical protein